MPRPGTGVVKGEPSLLIKGKLSKDVQKSAPHQFPHGGGTLLSEPRGHCATSTTHRNPDSAGFTTSW